jgi:hypothetical protein
MPPQKKIKETKEKIPLQESHSGYSQPAQPTQPVQIQPIVHAKQTDTYAILALVFAFIFAPLGIVFGIISLSRQKKDQNLDGKGLAVAGLVVGIVFTILYLLLLLFFILIFFFAFSQINAYPSIQCSFLGDVSCTSGPFAGAGYPQDTFILSFQNTGSNPIAITVDQAAVVQSNLGCNPQTFRLNSVDVSTDDVAKTYTTGIATIPAQERFTMSFYCQGLDPTNFTGSVSYQYIDQSTGQTKIALGTVSLSKQYNSDFYG